MAEKWVARAEYEDGFEIEQEFPYTANGNYARECKEQHEYEEWLATFADDHGAWTWYSVDYVNDL